MPAIARCEDSFLKIPVAIAKEDEGLCPRIVGLGFRFGPFGHFGGEDIEISITIDVADVQRVTVNQIASCQIVTDPIR